MQNPSASRNLISLVLRCDSLLLDGEAGIQERLHQFTNDLLEFINHRIIVLH